MQVFIPRIQCRIHARDQRGLNRMSDIGNQLANQIPVRVGHRFHDTQG